MRNILICVKTFYFNYILLFLFFFVQFFRWGTASPASPDRTSLKLPEVESRTRGSRPRTQKKSEAKAKDSLSEDRHSRGLGQECSRPRTQAQVLSKKKKVLYKNFSGDLHKKKKKKVFTKILQAISTKKRFPKNFSSDTQTFNNSKNTAVLEPRTGQF